MYNPLEPWSTVEYSKVFVQYATYYDEIPIPILYEVVTVGNKTLPPRPKKTCEVNSKNKNNPQFGPLYFMSTN